MLLNGVEAVAVALPPITMLPVADPDAVDEINFKWNQISCPSIVLSPNVYRSKVSFEGTPGEYTFELQVTDNYGAVTKMIKTVIIEREPNEAPIIDMKIRQGSELK